MKRILKMPEVITNRLLAKLSTVEFGVSLVVTVFLLGGLWSSINAKIAVAQTSAEKNGEKVLAVESVVNDIQMDIAIIKSNQAHAAEMTKEQTSELAEQRKDIKKILSLMGAANNGN